MRDTPAGLHILMSKLDISDGFWRLIVRGMIAITLHMCYPSGKENHVESWCHQQSKWDG